ncbi:MAG: hypothetical protein WEK74_11615 [Hydrogenophaga sp.]
MDDTDAFFTQTIVGAPLTVLMGRRLRADDSSLQGLEIDISAGTGRLSRIWQDWFVLNHEADIPGTPRKRPGALRRKLERHALWLGISGLLFLTLSVVFWGAVAWS